MVNGPETMTTQRDQSDKRARVTFRNISDFKDASTVDPPENFIAESFPSMSLRPRSLSHHLAATEVPSRRWLKIQARMWRSLMGLGMFFHDFAPPKPPKPDYIKKIKTDTKPIELLFYLPPNYYRLLQFDPDHRFPIVVNFHGGGFCLGDARDDRYWAKVLMDETDAVFVSVNYRLAPEHPFPIPVDDCVESLLYLSEHSPELHLDPMNVALSGFSAGANLCFSVPLRLAYYNKIKATSSAPSSPLLNPHSSHLQVPGASQENLSPTNTADSEASPETPNHKPQRPDYMTRDFAPLHTSTSNLLTLRTGTPLCIRTIVAWYPLLDWTMSRSQKKRESRNPKKCLPKVFTNLFDFSYLPPPDTEGAHCSPYASPGLAPDTYLQNGLPHDQQIWLCEWDMLLREGQKFAERLDKLGKNVESHVVPRVPHGWDKSPNPFRDQAAINMLYEKAARGVDEVFKSDDGTHTRASSINSGVAGRQPRKSMVPI